jgi:hypothetical protein
MNGELRALSLAHGLLLGLLLASPLFATAILPHAVSALFLLGGFQLRLADRRWDMRSGARAWISHVRMAPRRLLPWGAAALVAMIGGDGARAEAIVAAALLCELLVYPIGAHLLARLARPWVALVLALLIALGPRAASETMALILAFVTGIAACLVWLRGPDGDGRSLALMLGGGAAAALMPLLAPATTPYAFPTAATCLTLALAHLSVLRRRPLPWRADGGAGRRIRRPLWPLPSRLS